MWAALKEMINWYKNQTNTNIIVVVKLDVNNNNKFDGEVTTKSHKVYKTDDFSKFVEGRKESIKDLVSYMVLKLSKRVVSCLIS
jgi:hypothetical protein